MREPKRILTLTQAEYRLIIYGLVQWRNDLLEQGRYTDAIDEFLVKMSKAKKRRAI